MCTRRGICRTNIERVPSEAQLPWGAPNTHSRRILQRICVAESRGSFYSGLTMPYIEEYNGLKNNVVTHHVSLIFLT